MGVGGVVEIDGHTVHVPNVEGGLATNHLITAGVLAGLQSMTYALEEISVTLNTYTGTGMSLINARYC